MHHSLITFGHYALLLFYFYNANNATEKMTFLIKKPSTDAETHTPRQQITRRRQNKAIDANWRAPPTGRFSLGKAVQCKENFAVPCTLAKHSIKQANNKICNTKLALYRKSQSKLLLFFLTLFAFSFHTMTLTSRHIYSVSFPTLH